MILLFRIRLRWQLLKEMPELCLGSCRIGRRDCQTDDKFLAAEETRQQA